MKKTILSLEFEKASWSWGLVARFLQNVLASEYQFISRDFTQWRKKKPKEVEDLILSQNVVQLEYIYSHYKTIARMGGNRSFDRDVKRVDMYREKMSKCHSVIATNNNLYNIGKSVNPNTYLIPNGIDLKTWYPRKGRLWNPKIPVIGFIGNISTPDKMDYKGYPLVKEACNRLGLKIKTALYRNQQIPHSRMMIDFFYKIDLFILPTAGEGSSNSIMEALSCGVPCIIPRCAGYHGEMMEHGVNVLFCERTVDSIVEQIQTIRTTSGLHEQLSKKSRIFAEKHHDINDIATKYREVFTAFFNPVVQEVKESTTILEEKENPTFYPIVALACA